MDEEWKDLNVSLGLCPHLSVEDALCELVMNALDAAPTSVPEFTARGHTTVVLRDEGPGLPLESFTVGRTHGDNKLVGRFGLGLKDAVAVLMRNGATVEITSQRGSYRFEVKVGTFGNKTIHVQQQAPSDGVGTCITVSNLLLPAKSVEDVKALFICWSQLELLHSMGSVDVLQPPPQSGKQRGKLFVNGVAMEPPQPLYLSYNFKTPTLDQRMACGRDHNVEGRKFTELFKQPIEDALLSLPFDHSACPHAATCEFAWVDARKHFFLETFAPSASGRRASSKPRAVQQQPTGTQDPPRSEPSERQRLCQQLTDLARLPTPSKHPGRPSSVLTGSSAQLVTGPVTKAEIDGLIQALSQGDAVPQGHRNIVSQLSLTLQECPELSVSLVFPGGSYAKGTTIGSSSDVDLIVVLNNIPTTNHERWLYMLLANLRTIVERKFPDKCQVVKTTRFALQLRFPELDVDVDLLPVPAELWNKNKEDRQKTIKATPIRERPWLSVAFAQEQVAYVKSKKQTAGVTGIIRLIKRWAKSADWRSRRAKPSSYCIELLVIHAVSIAGHEDKLKLLRCFWQCVRDYHYLEVVLDEVPHADIAAERPLVVDPANPVNNVAGFDWREWQQHAARICDSRLREFISDLA